MIHKPPLPFPPWKPMILTSTVSVPFPGYLLAEGGPQTTVFLHLDRRTQDGGAVAANPPSLYLG